MAFSYRLAFATSLIIPPDQVVILDVESANDTDEATIHEIVLEAFRRWLEESETGMRIAEEIGDFPTLANVLDAATWEEVHSVMPYLDEAGITGFEYEKFASVWDLDESL
jgi:hypothetical protein